MCSEYVKRLKERIQKFVNILAQDFDVTPPRITIAVDEEVCKHVAGYYNPLRREIVICLKGVPQPAVETVIHEFVHHVQYERRENVCTTELDKPHAERVCEKEAYNIAKVLTPMYEELYYQNVSPDKIYGVATRTGTELWSEVHEVDKKLKIALGSKRLCELNSKYCENYEFDKQSLINEIEKLWSMLRCIYYSAKKYAKIHVEKYAVQYFNLQHLSKVTANKVLEVRDLVEKGRVDEAYKKFDELKQTLRQIYELASHIELKIDEEQIELTTKS